MAPIGTTLTEAIQTKEGRSRFSWIILEAHTSNQGEVRLRTTDPRDPPEINFKSFGDGQRANDSDLKRFSGGSTTFAGS
jgi:choline dehydrogenase